MNYKNIFIILLLILIIIILKTQLNSEHFNSDSRCMGLSTPIGMTCGNYSVNDEYCSPDPNDCFTLYNQKRCWCKILNN